MDNQWIPQLSNYFKAEVLFQNDVWSIEKYRNNNTGQFAMCVIKDAFKTDWVMVYTPGKISFDNPERIPTYIKAKVRLFSLTLNS